MKGLEKLRQSLIHYLLGKGMAPGAIPFFVRGLATSLRGNPHMEISSLNQRMRQMGWEGFFLDETSLCFARSCIEAAGLEYLDKPYRRFVGNEYEQETFFIKDPNGNVLEMKSMKNPELMFK